MSSKEELTKEEVLEYIDVAEKHLLDESLTEKEFDELSKVAHRKIIKKRRSE